MRETDIDALATAATTLGEWLLAAPAAGPLAAATNPDTLERWPLAPTGHTRRGLRFLARWREKAEADMNHAAEQVHLDHDRLLPASGSPDLVTGALHETELHETSRHENERHENERAEAGAAAAWYDRFGVRAPQEYDGREGHLGLELQFFATMLTWAIDAAIDAENTPPTQPLHESGSVGGEDEEPGAFIAAASRFCSEHLMARAPAVFRHLHENATTDFYRGAGSLGLGLVDAIALVLRGATPLPH